MSQTHMVDYNLIADIGIDFDEIDAMITASLGQEVAEGNMDTLISSEIQQFIPGNMLKGKIVGKAGDDAVIDVGLKSEG
ncbi:MAG: 30S ribosomal protein S1, partial [Phycisphaerales bacterium]|nr:30S ribosomal protein S1 [Phycisphaerales bacterium]